MTTFATLASLTESAIAARQAGDYDAAIGYATDALLYLGTAPDTENSGQNVYFRNADHVQAFIASCRKMKTSAAMAGSGPIQQTKILYERPEVSDSYE